MFQTSMKRMEARPVYSFFSSAIMGAIILQGMHLFAPRSTMVTRPGVGTCKVTVLWKSPANAGTTAQTASIVKIKNNRFDFFIDFPSIITFRPVCIFTSRQTGINNTGIRRPPEKPSFKVDAPSVKTVVIRFAQGSHVTWQTPVGVSTA
jgi:hypothetical protein